MASREERVQGTQGNYNSIGLPGNEETVRWLYDHHLAAVAGDMTAFEAWPADFGSGYVLHEWFVLSVPLRICQKFFANSVKGYSRSGALRLASCGIWRS